MTKVESVYKVLHQRMEDGTYVPGYRLVLDALAEEFSVSTVPVREAVRRLEAEGWVTYRPNQGPIVAPAGPGGWEEKMHVLAVLEGHATALATGHLTPKDIKELWSINGRMADALRTFDPDSFSRLNREFHSVIYSRCPNRYLVELSEQTFQRLRRIRQTVFTHIPGRASSVVEEHAHLVELLTRHAEFEAIEQAARAHKLRTIKAYHESNPPR